MVKKKVYANLTRPRVYPEQKVPGVRIVASLKYDIKA